MCGNSISFGGKNMRNLLVGNGINIQFDKISYSTKEIVLRILKNCDREDLVYINEKFVLVIFIEYITDGKITSLKVV